MGSVYSLEDRRILDSKSDISDLVVGSPRTSETVFFLITYIEARCVGYLSVLQDELYQSLFKAEQNNSMKAQLRVS